MKPADLVQKLQQALGPGLQSVILYGSAAAGDHVGKRSDYNVLVIAKKLGITELTALAKPSIAWRRAGNPSPLFFTLDRMQKSADTFPIELLDIKESHRVLFGNDALKEVQVHTDNLRLILEHELKSNLIRLRENFLLTEAKPKRVANLMIESLSTFLVLFRAALRLYQKEVPPLKLDALRALAGHVRFDIEVFQMVEELKEGRRNIKDSDPLALFEAYLKSIEAAVDAVDTNIQPPRPRSGV